MIANVELILGGPGCAKTSRAIEIVKEELAAGTRPDAIAFVSFTKEAANVARGRAAAAFSLDEDQLRYFRTIHSLTYQALGLTRDEVLNKHDWKQFSELVGERLTGVVYENMFGGDDLGDKMLRVIDYAATTGRNLDEAWRATGEEIDWWRLRRFDATYAKFKATISKMDFTDMLLAYTREGDVIPVEVAVIDEAQDLTRAQWRVVEKAFSTARRVVIVGDDDQAIYPWAGADIETFLTLSGRRCEILPLSYRLPWTVWRAAQSLVERITTRYVKAYRPWSDRIGVVESHYHIDDVPLTGHETWLLLARNNYYLRALEAFARESGVSYRTRRGPAVDKKEVAVMRLYEDIRAGRQTEISADEARALAKALDRPRPALKETPKYDPKLMFTFDEPWYVALTGIEPERADYYASCVRRGTSLTGEPNVRIDTIHGVKGAEADNVLLMTDMSARTARGFERAPDNEHRVFYVGATRARNALHIVAPQHGGGYPF